MMNPEDREYAKNRAINMSRAIGAGARACAIAFGCAGLCSVAGAFIVAFSPMDAHGAPIFINDYEVSGVVAPLYCIIIAVTAFCLALMLRALFQLCSSIEQRRTPFYLENVKALERIAYFTIAAALVWGLGTYALELAFHAPIGNLSAILWVWAGVVVLFLARVFEYGCALQEQDDELL